MAWNKRILFSTVVSLLVSAQLDSAVDIAQLKAAQKEALAVYNTGVSYERGDGVSKNFNTAVSYYRKAADMGDHNAQFRLGFFYYKGKDSIAQDYKVAADYLLLAAKQCNPDAQQLLGVCYLMGHGVSKDEAEAYKWAYLGALNGGKDAVVTKQKLEGILSDSKIEAGKSRAVAFLKALQAQYGLQ